MINCTEYADLLILQMKNKRQLKEILYGNKIILKPRNENEYLDQSVIIGDKHLLNQSIEAYWLAIQQSNSQFSKIDDRHQLKYFITNIWKNAVNQDCQEPSYLYSRFTDFLNNKFFLDIYNTPLKLGTIQNQSLYVVYKDTERGFETPYELSFFITNNNDVEDIYYLPSIRFGISQKKVFVYALQNNHILSRPEVLTL